MCYIWYLTQFITFIYNNGWWKKEKTKRSWAHIQPDSWKPVQLGFNRDSWVTVGLQLKNNLKKVMSCIDCALGCTGLIKQNTWWWSARYLKTFVLSSSSHLGRPRETQQTHWIISRRGLEAPTGVHKHDLWLLSLAVWSAAPLADSAVQSLQSKTTLVPLLYLRVLLSGCIWFHMSHVWCPPFFFKVN